MGNNMGIAPQETVLCKRTVVSAAASFVVALVVYGLSAYLVGRTHSPKAAHFDQLAEAFLHGRLYLTNPRSISDLTLFANRWYVAFPPLPALLLLPWVALAGVERVNTVMFAIGMGATNVALAFLMLQSLALRGWTRLSLANNLWLTVLFGVGSVHWYMATLGAVWFLGQICAVTFMLLSVLLAVTTASPILSGSALAVAMLSRPHVMLSYPLLFGVGIQGISGVNARPEWRRWIRWGVVSIIPIGVTVVLLLGYNYMRFNNAFDFGYFQMNVDQRVAEDMRTYGWFHLHYVPRNLWTMWLETPTWDAVRRRLVPDDNGMSLLLTTPALVYLVRARSRAPFVIGAWVALALLLVPLVTYYNTGWRQFGYRFSLDFMTPVLVLLGVAAERSEEWLMNVVILLGVLVNAWGVWWFRFFSR